MRLQKTDLKKPIGETRPARKRSPRRPLVAPVIISAALILALVAAFWVAVVDDPDGGRSVVVAAIEDSVPSATGSVPSAPPMLPATASPEGIPSGPLPDDETQLASLPHLPPPAAGDPSLIEYSSFGPLPRVSPDGRRPRESYARRSPPLPEGVARVVIVVGGLGLSQTGTQQALQKLPEDVTLAFAPYGSSLQRWVRDARDGGHEVLLQIPLEPLDPKDNPGEHTLSASDGAAMRQDLHWALGRMTSYAGVMNHMGGSFTANERAMVPFIGEIGERGLFYLDDGSSMQSLAKKVGDALQVPVVTADRTLDLDRAPDGIERELAALEAIARTRGLAIGVASAFPDTVDTIARWVEQAKARGIVIVPASAALAPPTRDG